MHNKKLFKSLLVTILMVVLFRVGSMVPAVGVRPMPVVDSSNPVMDFFNLISGGSLYSMTWLSLGVMPFITASILVQIVVSIVPRLKELKKEGETGQDKILQIARYLTIVFAFIQASSLVYMASTNRLYPGSSSMFFSTEMIVLAGITISLTIGSIVAMWFGEVITQYGVGQGVSIIILAGIAAQVPTSFYNSFTSMSYSQKTWMVVMLLAILLFVVIIEQSVRRVPVRFAKYSRMDTVIDSYSYLPLKISQSNVIPVIFASSLMIFPLVIDQVSSTFFGMDNKPEWFRKVIEVSSDQNSWIYLSIFAVLIVFFSFIYTSVQYDPEEQAENLGETGAYIEGVRFGKETEGYVWSVMRNLLFGGSLYLAIVALIPMIVVGVIWGIDTIPFSGTSILILMSVSLMTIDQIRSLVAPKKALTEQNKREALLASGEGKYVTNR